VALKKPLLVQLMAFLKQELSRWYDGGANYLTFVMQVIFNVSSRSVIAGEIDAAPAWVAE